MRNKRGFTLVELLVVIAIIAILAAILMPVFTAAKSASYASKCTSNLRQIGAAMTMYAQDNGDSFSHADYRYGTNGMYVCQGWDWGKWFWMFTCMPYLSCSSPMDWHQPASGRSVFCCPAFHVIHSFEKSGQMTALYQGGLANKWGLVLGAVPGTTKQTYAIWCSYAINEHIPYSSWRISSWQRPTRSFLLLEASDTEITSDQLYWKCTNANHLNQETPFKIYSAHSGGTCILYIDGHVERHKSAFQGNPENANTIWTFPPGGPTGGLGPGQTPETDVGKDRGPWTATASDDQ